MIDNYYQNVMTCIKTAIQMNIPHSVKADNHNVHAVAGWNDIVRDEHDAARAAFVDWVAADKPRQGPVFVLMNRSRAAFKLAMLYCKQHEDMIRADNLANSIADKEYGAFWKHVHKQQKGKAVNYAAVVGGCAGEKEIAVMWGHHFEQLYNSIQDDQSKNSFYECLDNSDGGVKFTISEHDLLVCIGKQKKGKSVGLDNIAMEAFIYGGLRLLIHVCFFV